MTRISVKNIKIITIARAALLRLFLLPLHLTGQILLHLHSATGHGTTAVRNFTSVLISVFPTEILAVADGVVEVGTGCNHNYPKDGSCGCNGGFGNYVEIQCENGTLILYGHMSQVAVQNGQTVKNGQVIGYSGCTGWSTGFHCHLQMVKDGEYIDPLVFIRPYTGAPAEKEENN